MQLLINSEAQFCFRTHDKLLLNKTSYLEREFLIRMLYKDSY